MSYAYTHTSCKFYDLMIQRPNKKKEDEKEDEKEEKKMKLADFV